MRVFFLLVRLKRKTKWISNDRYSFPYVYMEPVFVFYSQNKSIPHPKLIWREQWILSLFFSRKKMRKFRTMVNVHFYKYRGNRFQFHFSLKKILFFIIRKYRVKNIWFQREEKDKCFTIERWTKYKGSVILWIITWHLGLNHFLTCIV